jgi:hypothetical protein
MMILGVLPKGKSHHERILVTYLYTQKTRRSFDRVSVFRNRLNDQNAEHNPGRAAASERCNP